MVNIGTAALLRLPLAQSPTGSYSDWSAARTRRVGVASGRWGRRLRRVMRGCVTARTLLLLLLLVLCEVADRHRDGQLAVGAHDAQSYRLADGELLDERLNLLGSAHRVPVELDDDIIRP